MSTDRCARSWEAEAVTDGRLGAGERFSFERHAQGCPVCRREFAELSALDATMRELQILESTPFERQRLRNRLLQQVDQELFGKGRRRASPLRFAFAAVAVSCVLVVGVALGWLGGIRLGAGDERQAATLLPEFELQSANRASWDDRSVGSVARIVLKSGTVSVKVHHLRAQQRFLLVLPDGEIEVHGTRFIVELGEKQTARVDVTEGAVSLRLEGQAERTLLAGDHWERPVAAAMPMPAKGAAPPAPPASSTSPALASPASPSSALAAAPAVSAPSRNAGASASSAPVAAQRVKSSAPSSGHDVARREAPTSAGNGAGSPLPSAEAARESTEAPARSSGPDAALEKTGFSAGMAAFRRGEYANAERLLSEFMRGAGGDPRREDAAFVRAVARSRLGDARGAAELATSYLKSYPNGLRRAEAERIVRAAK